MITIPWIHDSTFARWTGLACEMSISSNGTDRVSDVQLLLYAEHRLPLRRRGVKNCFGKSYLPPRIFW